MTAAPVTGRSLCPERLSLSPVCSPPLLLSLALASQFHTRWMPLLSFFSRSCCQGRRAQSSASSSAWRTEGRRPPEGPPHSAPRPPAVLPPSGLYAPGLSHLRPIFLTLWCPAAWRLKAQRPQPCFWGGGPAQGNKRASQCQGCPGRTRAPLAGTSPMPGTGPFPPASRLPRWFSFSQAAPGAESRGKGDQGTAGQGKAGQGRAGQGRARQ